MKASRTAPEPRTKSVLDENAAERRSTVERLTALRDRTHGAHAGIVRDLGALETEVRDLEKERTKRRVDLDRIEKERVGTLRQRLAQVSELHRRVSAYYDEMMDRVRRVKDGLA